MSFPNKKTRFVNRDNWADLIALEPGEAFTLTTRDTLCLSNSLFYSVKEVC